MSRSGIGGGVSGGITTLTSAADAADFLSERAAAAAAQSDVSLAAHWAQLEEFYNKKYPNLPFLNANMSIQLKKC